MIPISSVLLVLSLSREQHLLLAFVCDVYLLLFLKEQRLNFISLLLRNRSFRALEWLFPLSVFFARKNVCTRQNHAEHNSKTCVSRLKKNALALKRHANETVPFENLLDNKDDGAKDVVVHIVADILIYLLRMCVCEEANRPKKK